MRSTSSRYWLATSETEMDPMVTFCLVTSWSRRSKGPDQLCVRTR
jgi:hypothetical protein